MAVVVTEITVDVSEVCAITVVSTDIVAVVDSEGVTCTVLISSAWAASCGDIINHRAKSAVINADLSINFLINLSPLYRQCLLR
jgi:hypothetical protein